MTIKEPTFAERLAQAQQEAEWSAKVSYPNGKSKSQRCAWDNAFVRHVATNEGRRYA